LLISVPANAFVQARFNVYPIAHLPVSAGVVLVVISVGLTLVAGILPSGRAAKEDPVEALRAE
ncbi:MAG: ABC superfamily ATP binding cassette transporter, ABC protein, partial [Actinomyces urogenitalis DORA_12]